MPLNLNTNNNQKINVQPASNNLQAAPPNNQNAALSLLNQPIQDTYEYQNNTQNIQTQNKKPKSKIFIGLVIVGAGTAIGALVHHLKGKNTSAKEVKAAADTIKSTANNLAKKADAATESAPQNSDNPSKTSIFKKAKEKLNSFIKDVKDGYDDYTPPPKETTTGRTNNPRPSKPVKPPKPKRPAVIMREKIAEKFASFETSIQSISKMSDEADKYAKLSHETYTAGTEALSNNTETEAWAKKILDETSTSLDSFIKHKKFGKSNAFIRTNADNWEYYEGYSKSLTKKAKIQKRIKAEGENITVTLDHIKGKKTETAGELFKFNKTTGDTKHYIDYKKSNNSISYPKGVIKSRDVDTYIENYKMLEDGTVTIAKQVNNNTNSAKSQYFEDAILKDDKRIYSKVVTYEADKPTHYIQECVEYSDTSYEALKEMDLTKRVYLEAPKVNIDGIPCSAQRKIQFNADGKPSYIMEAYKKTASGEIKADTRIEYIIGTDKPKYYFENYTYSPTTGKEKYSLKAEFRDGKWYRIK